ncbi:hypothetical protein LCGC14_0221360 [marine sediment metagenome]|uniref:Uncharacterized protein n=1 Tax=marine sediment metagenome TaxID=412755 RepID=A0A0F9XH83_9ZZZZ
MKNRCIIFILLAFMVMPITGCTTFGDNGGWQDNVVQLKDDIFMFSKLATRIALTEAQMPSEDVELIEGYLVALGDLLSVPGQPNFTGARALVSIKLPQKYQVYGLTIIDVLERYLQTANLNITDDQEDIIAIISSGIDGALVAVREFME